MWQGNKITAGTKTLEFIEIIKEVKTKNSTKPYAKSTHYHKDKKSKGKHNESEEVNFAQKESHKKSLNESSPYAIIDTGNSTAADPRN